MANGDDPLGAGGPAFRPLPASLTFRTLPDELQAFTMGSLDNRPPRASLVNLATGDEYLFLFNPETFEESFEAKYNRVQVNGLSHERLAYKNTGNDTIPLELYLSQLAQDHLSGAAGSRPFVATHQKRWLQSLVYPAASQDFSFVGPPRVLFIWPRMVRLIGRVTKVSFLHRDFSNRTLATTRLVARLEFEEDVELARSMDDVLTLGSMQIADAEEDESGGGR
jgi:hypothetical protein